MAEKINRVVKSKFFVDLYNVLWFNSCMVSRWAAGQFSNSIRSVYKMTDLIQPDGDMVDDEMANVVDESQNGETGEVASDETATNVDDIKKLYFTSAKLADAQTEIEKVNAIAEEHELDMIFNFDTEKDFPSGYGIAIVPVSKRDKAAKENVIVGVAIAAIPDLATVEQHENGKQFILDAVSGNMIAKLANAVRPRGDSGDSAASIPYSVDDFITSNRPEGVLLAYRKFASAYVKVLKKKGLKYITDSILRQTLQSAAFAEQQFPSVGQDKWVSIKSVIL